MCSLSWFKDADNALHLFFNRDERKTRSRALHPAIYQDDTTQWISPVDPDGGGTWLAVNQSGLIVALLNNYDSNVTSVDELMALMKAKLQERTWTSRGLLTTALVKHASPEQAAATLTAMDLADYMPFCVLLASRDVQYFYCWDGKKLVKEQATSFISSCAVNADRVLASRQAHYASHYVADVTSAIAFHSSHHTDDHTHTICMHREEAHTVSLSHIRVDADTIQFDYWDGNPCQQPEKRSISCPLEASLCG